jgi:hypothetical protein
MYFGPGNHLGGEREASLQGLGEPIAVVLDLMNPLRAH